VSATSGTVSISGGLLSWTGPLATGANVTITFSIDINNPVTGTGQLASVQ
jgi:hypothetical protein